MNIKKVFLSLVAVSVFVLAPITAFAQEASPSTKRNCADVQNTMDQRIEAWKANHDRKVQRWQTATDRLVALADRLQDRGYDVQQLRDDAAQIETYLYEQTVNYRNIVTKSSETKTSACGDRDVLRTMVDDTRALIQDAQTDWQTIRNFMNDVKSHVMSYRDVTLQPSQ